MKAKPARRLIFETKVVNLSEGGAYLETGEKLLPGTEIILFMTLDVGGKKKNCVVQGRVAWANNDRTKGAVGCGVAFDKVPASIARHLRDFVQFSLKGDLNAVGTTDEPQGPKTPTRGQLRG